MRCRKSFPDRLPNALLTVLLLPRWTAAVLLLLLTVPYGCLAYDLDPHPFPAGASPDSAAVGRLLRGAGSATLHLANGRTVRLSQPRLDGGRVVRGRERVDAPVVEFRAPLDSVVRIDVRRFNPIRTAGYTILTSFGAVAAWTILRFIMAAD
jgi:hypothetical protein